VLKIIQKLLPVSLLQIRVKPSVATDSGIKLFKTSRQPNNGFSSSETGVKFGQKYGLHSLNAPVKTLSERQSASFSCVSYLIETLIPPMVGTEVKGKSSCPKQIFSCDGLALTSSMLENATSESRWNMRA
jgi:hypothetical protein